MPANSHCSGNLGSVKSSLSGSVVVVARGAVRWRLCGMTLLNPEARSAEAKNSASTAAFRSTTMINVTCTSTFRFVSFTVCWNVRERARAACVRVVSLIDKNLYELRNNSRTYL